MRIRQHANPNMLFYERMRVTAPTVIADGRAVEVEIGCADAQFLFERAAQDPTRAYVGLEIREDLVTQVNRRARAAEVPVEAVFCQAQHHIDSLFAPASVDRVYLNFPDPWFKARHHDRRMIDERLAAGIARVVRPGGEVFMQSDVWDIALDAMDELERQDHAFANKAGDWRFWRGGNPFGVRSWREQNAEETGLPIWRIYYDRR